MENRQIQRKNDRIRKVRKTNIRLNIIFFISIFITLFLIFTFVRQRIIIADLNKEYQLLQAEQESMKLYIQDLVEEIQDVNSLEYIEKKAREDLGMIKKDENIYINSDETDEESEVQSNGQTSEKVDEESFNEIDNQ